MPDTIDIIEFIGQAFGIAGTVVAILSFQCKDNKKFFIWQAVCGVLFAVNFMLIGNTAIALLQFFNIIRALSFGFTGGRTRGILAIAVVIMYAVSTAITFDGLTLAGIMAMLALVAQIVGTTVMYMDDGKIIRIAQLFFISPVFLLNSIIPVLSVGGVLCEVFNLTSITVALIRYRKEGFVSVNNKSEE